MELEWLKSEGPFVFVCVGGFFFGGGGGGLFSFLFLVFFGCFSFFCRFLGWFVVSGPSPFWSLGLGWPGWGRVGCVVSFDFFCLWCQPGVCCGSGSQARFVFYFFL